MGEYFTGRKNDVMDRKVLTRCKRRLRNSLRNEPTWQLIKSYVTRVKTEIAVDKTSYLQVQFKGKWYFYQGKSFNSAARFFIEAVIKTNLYYSTFQGTKIMNTNQGHIVAKMFKTAEANGVLTQNPDAHYKLSTLNPVADDKVVKNLIEETVDEHGFREIYDDYVRTDEITDVDLHVEGLMVHFSPEGNKPCYLDEDDICDMVLDSWVHEAPIEGCEYHVSSFDPISLAMLKVESSSTGNFTEDPQKKQTCAVETAGIVAIQAQTGLAKTAPYKSAEKLEVIKKWKNKNDPQKRRRKKVRTIQVDPADNALAAEAITGSAIRASNQLEGGSAIGVPTNGGYGMRLFRQLTRPLGDDLDKAEEEAIRRGLHESDMVAFEATQKPATSLAYILFLISVLGSLAEAGAVAANFFANYHMPHFSITDEAMYHKEGGVASGTKLTAHGNTFRHRLMIVVFKLYVMRHDMFLGKADCSCQKCELMKDHPDYGREMNMLEIKLLACAVKMGDDFLALWTLCSEFYDAFCDNVCGTVHTTERLGLFEGSFLKRRFKKVKGFWTTYVREEDAIPKFKGPGMITAENKMAACINAAANCNNKAVYDFAKDLYSKIEQKFGRTKAVDDALVEAWKGMPDCVGFPSWEVCEARHLPLPSDLMLTQANFESVMATNLPCSITMAA